MGDARAVRPYLTRYMIETWHEILLLPLGSINDKLFLKPGRDARSVRPLGNRHHTRHFT